ncbi:hypothetical protein BB559_000771 [Furculomyces boomerangus]|uniref:Protein AAR2 homolog n=2 Tax=Harpellales TaxID=61421 RepID=A0A2T9Z463_9FUNG|nr:hypothetical protein BB559_000771 [Furculomyces boomerangus]PVZ98762.1 hypothetical protein BB558_005231 [Smittium angustum]
MDNETALSLYDKGGFFVVTNCPKKIEFGIDLHLWETSNNFMGLKLVPPGLHLLSYSSIDKKAQTGMKSSFFQWFDEGQLVVKKWDGHNEIMVIDESFDSDQIGKMRQNIRELDKNLGAYPLSKEDVLYGKWRTLTKHIQKSLLEAVLPPNGCFSSATSSVYDIEEYEIAQKKINKSQNVNDKTINEEGSSSTKSDSGNMPSIEQQDSFKFPLVDIKKSFDKNASAEQITKYSRDKTWLLQNLIKNVYKQDVKRLLGEVQLSFLILLIGQNFSGLEHWKRLVYLVCSSQEAISSNLGLELFIPFIKILQSQLMECPKDFFSSILTEDNFFSVSLKELVINIEYSENQDVANKLKKELNELRTFLKSHFGWMLPTSQDLLAEEEEDEEYAPVLVEL